MNPAASDRTIALYPEKRRLLRQLQFYRLLVPTPVVVVNDQGIVTRPPGGLLVHLDDGDHLARDRRYVPAHPDSHGQKRAPDDPRTGDHAQRSRGIRRAAPRGASAHLSPLRPPPGDQDPPVDS